MVWRRAYVRPIASSPPTMERDRRSFLLILQSGRRDVRSTIAGCFNLADLPSFGRRQECITSGYRLSRSRSRGLGALSNAFAQSYEHTRPALNIL